MPNSIAATPAMSRPPAREPDGLRRPVDVTTLALPPAAEDAIAAGRLNRAQAAAIYAPAGPVLVLGPPGTGKTTSLIERLVYLQSMGIHPGQFFIGTFTGQSAAEIVSRTAARMGGRFLPPSGKAEDLTVGTLNSLGQRLLRVLAPRAGYGSSLRLMRGAEARDLCRRLSIDLRQGRRPRRPTPAGTEASPPLNSLPATAPIVLPGMSSFAAPPPPAEHLGWFGPGFGGAEDIAFGDAALPQTPGAALLQTLLAGKRPAASFLGAVHHLSFLDIVSRWKEKLITPEDAIRYATGAEGSAATADEELAGIAQDYARYVQAQRDAGVIDFADQIALPVHILRTNDALRATVQGRWKAVIGDEYQDVNTASGALVELLAGAHRNLWCVGDPDQTLYSFRGSDPNYILDFPARWQDASVIALTDNYRCRPTIVAAANRLIRRNKDRYETSLTAVRAAVALPEPIGRALTTPGLFRPADEVRVAATEVVTYPDDVTEAMDTARKIRGLIDAGVSPNAIAVLLRANFRSFHLAQALRGHGVGIRVLRGSDAAEPEESQIVDGLLRGANHTAGGPGATDAATICRLLGTSGPRFDRLLAAATRLKSDLASGAISDWAGLCAAVDAVLCAEAALDQAGSARWLLRARSTLQAAMIAGSYEAWCAAAPAAPPPPDRSTRAAPLDAGAAERAVGVATLGTIHGSKGLEFDHVFLPGFEQDVSPAEGDAGNEEERRLAYVAITRARDSLTASHVRQRAGDRFEARPSVYIEEAFHGLPGVSWTDFAGPAVTLSTDPSPPVSSATLDLEALGDASASPPPRQSERPHPIVSPALSLPPRSAFLAPVPAAAPAAIARPVQPAQPPATPPAPAAVLEHPPASRHAMPSPGQGMAPAGAVTAPGSSHAAPTAPKNAPAFILAVDGGTDGCPAWRVSLTADQGGPVYQSLINWNGNFFAKMAARSSGVDASGLDTAPSLGVVAGNVLDTLTRAATRTGTRPIVHLPTGIGALQALGLTQELTPARFDLRLPADQNT